MIHGKVYFVQRNAGKYSSDGLYVYDAGTRKVEAIVKGADLDGPVAGFDVFRSRAAVDTHRGLYLVDLTNHHISPLTRSNTYDCPMFSPDGQKLAMVRNLRELVVRDLRGGSDTLLYLAR